MSNKSNSAKKQQHKLKIQKKKLLDDDLKVLDEFKKDAELLLVKQQEEIKKRENNVEKEQEFIRQRQKELKERIARIELLSPSILGKNGKLTHTKEINKELLLLREKLLLLRKELTDLKNNKTPAEIKNMIRSDEEDMLTMARREMDSIKGDMSQFFDTIVTKQDNMNDPMDSSNDMINNIEESSRSSNTKRKRSNSTSSNASFDSIKSYQSTSSEFSESDHDNDTKTRATGQTTSAQSTTQTTSAQSTTQTTSAQSTTQTNEQKSQKTEPLITEKDIITKADGMWQIVKEYVKSNPKFKNLQDKKKLEIFRERLGFGTFMEEFPIVSRYMICMGQYKSRAFQRFLDKMKRAKHPPPNERPKNYMEDQWIRWQADYVQYLWEEYQKRHYNNAERKWVWEETYKRLKGEFDDFRKMHDDIEEKIKEEKEELAAKNARELLERLQTGLQKLDTDEEAKLLKDLDLLVIKKNYGIVMQELLQKVKPTEVNYDFASHPLVLAGAMILPCCGILIDMKTYPAYTISTDSSLQVIKHIMNENEFKPNSNKELYTYLDKLRQQYKEDNLDAEKTAEMESIQKQYNIEAYDKLCRFYRASMIINNPDNVDIMEQFTDSEKDKAREIVSRYINEIKNNIISSSWSNAQIPLIKCKYCQGNLNNFDATYRSHYLPYMKGTGAGRSENAPKITMIETVDVNRMNEIDDKYRPEELRGMEPITEEDESVIKEDETIAEEDESVIKEDETIAENNTNI